MKPSHYESQLGARLMVPPTPPALPMMATPPADLGGGMAIAMPAIVYIARALAWFVALAQRLHGSTPVYIVVEKSIAAGGRYTYSVPDDMAIPERWVIYTRNTDADHLFRAHPSGDVPASGAAEQYANKTLTIPAVSRSVSIHNSSDATTHFHIIGVASGDFDASR